VLVAQGTVPVGANGQTPEATEQEGLAGDAERIPEEPPSKEDVDTYDDWLIGIDERYFLEHINDYYSGDVTGTDADVLAAVTEEDIEKAAVYYKALAMAELAAEQNRELTQKEKDYIAYMQELLFGESAEWLQGQGQGGDGNAAQAGGATGSSSSLTTLSGSEPIPGDPDYWYDGSFIGTYPIEDGFVKGKVLVTDDGAFGVLPTGHSAMTYGESDNSAITALGGLSSGSGSSSGGSSAGGSSSSATGDETGVVLEDNDWNHRHATCFVVDVTETDTDEEADVADWCYGHYGKPYTINFFDTSSRDTFYCSKLVWAGFLDNYDIDLNTEEYSYPILGDAIHPMELVRTPLTKLLYQHGAVATSETGWLDISGYHYYVDSLGQPLAAMQLIGGSTYYFRTDNNFPGTGPEYSMVTGKQYLGGTYYMGEDGQYHSTGVGGHWYYFNASGKAQVGWQSIGGSMYYFRPMANSPTTGPKYSAVTGSASFGGSTYFFNSNGVLVSSTSNTSNGSGGSYGPAPGVPYWTAPTEVAPISDALIKTYGVRDGSAGPDFLGITNTNFDFTHGPETSNEQYVRIR
jgi:hypothetical protein